MTVQQLCNAALLRPCLQLAQGASIGVVRCRTGLCAPGPCKLLLHGRCRVPPLARSHELRQKAAKALAAAREAGPEAAAKVGLQLQVSLLGSALDVDCLSKGCLRAASNLKRLHMEHAALDMYLSKFTHHNAGGAAAERSRSAKVPFGRLAVLGHARPA